MTQRHFIAAALFAAACVWGVAVDLIPLAARETSAVASDYVFDELVAEVAATQQMDLLGASRVWPSTTMTWSGCSTGPTI
jgi:hypothetical protein